MHALSLVQAGTSPVPGLCHDKNGKATLEVPAAGIDHLSGKVNLHAMITKQTCKCAQKHGRVNAKHA